jgi:hypothetical protein
LTWGSHREFLEGIVRETGTTPAALSSRPVLFEDLYFYWKSFWLLSASRSWTFGGPAGITVSDIKSYLDVVGIRSAETRVEFLEIVSALDARWVELVRSRSKRESK